MKKRFLMLTSRVNETVAASERADLLRFTGLNEEELVNVRMEQGNFPKIDYDEWDGIILCGSHFDVSAPKEKKVGLQDQVETYLNSILGEVQERDFPFLGICYGLGLMTKRLGGRVGYEISEDISAPVLTITEEGRKDPILEGIPDHFRAYVGHHESVLECPQGMTRLVAGEVAPVQMGRVGKNIYLTQFHPELDFNAISIRIDVFADFGYYPPEERAAVEERVSGVDVSPSHLLLRNFANRFAGRAEASR